MALYVSTTGSNVVINELGITITHPTTDLELVAQFGTERITLSETLTTAIQSGALTWKRTLVGGTLPAGSYNTISAENEELTVEMATDAELAAAIATRQPLDATLTALAAFNTNGILVQTAADTFTARTITGTASNISVTNGNGVSGNPTLDLINSGAVAGSYGSAVNIPIITVDAKGRITSITFATLNPATTTATGTNNITTTSTSDVLMTGMQIANPPAGTYQVLASTVLRHNTNNATVFMSAYVGGTKVTASEQFAVPVFKQGGTPSITIPSGVTVLAEVTVNGSQNIEARWRTTSGTANCTNRTINIQRIR